MESTGYEALNRRPGGDSRFSNGGTRGSGKTLQSKGDILSQGGSGPLKSADLHSVGGSQHGNSRPTSRRELHAEMAAARSPVVLHPVNPPSKIGKPGVREESPAASPVGSAQFVEMARNVRRRPK